MTFVFWFYHCGSCGVVSTKFHPKCLVCGAENNLSDRQAAIAVRASDNFTFPISVGMQADVRPLSRNG